MIYLESIYPHQKCEMSELKAFLERSGLRFESIDMAILLKEKDRIVGSCCRAFNVIKMVAIDPAYQAMNLLDQLMTAMQEHLFDQGIHKSFIFTPAHNAPLFKPYHYKQIIQVEGISFLEKGRPNIHEHINYLIQTYNPHLLPSGAIVINGNPFTLGHQYLIETASQSVEKLFVFVVEEDASFFDFKTRLELIKKGTQHLNNVVVLPSSPYIISQATFPNYFLRQVDDHFKHYASLDAHVFGSYFSQLNIRIRFVGDEPLDIMTHAYNETLQSVLSSYKMEVKIIKRLSNDDGIISASKVRALLKIGDYDGLKKYLPKTTWEFLKANPHYEIHARDYGREH